MLLREDFKKRYNFDFRGPYPHLSIDKKKHIFQLKMFQHFLIENSRIFFETFPKIERAAILNYLAVSQKYLSLTFFHLQLSNQILHVVFDSSKTNNFLHDQVPDF